MTQKKRDWSKVLRNGLILLIALPFLAGAAYFSNFFVHASQFNDFYKTDNPVAAEAELEDMRSYYDQATSIPVVDWVANNFIFEDMPIYEARYFYMIGDYENVYDILDGVEDWRAQHILGSARYRTSKSLFRANEEGNAQAIESMVEESKRHFRIAVVNSPDSNFDDVWNYDLIQNDKQRKKSYQSKSKQKKPKLGYKPGGDGDQSGPQGDQDSDGDKSLFPSKGNKAGEGDDGPRKP